MLMSVTEGEDKPLKYPTIFNSADLAVLTKIDLVEAAGFDRDLARCHIEAVRPGLPIVETSTRTDEGFDRWLDILRSRLAGTRR